MVDVPTMTQFNALATRVTNLGGLSSSLTTRVAALESALPAGQQAALPTPTPTTPASPTPTPSGFQSVTPTRNGDFLALWGVDGQIGANVAAYLDAAGVAADTAYIGARRFRDSLSATGAGQTPVLQALANIGVTLIGHPPAGNLVIATLVAAVKTWHAMTTSGAVALLEGPDEPFKAAINYGGVAGGGASGAWTSVATFQRDWHTAVKADPAISAIVVATPTGVAQETPNVGLQFATIPTGAGATLADGTVYADGLAMHLYPVVNSAVVQTVDAAGDHILSQLSADFVTTTRGSYTGYNQGQAMSLSRFVTAFGLSSTSTAIIVNEDIKGKNLLTGMLNLRRTGYRLVVIHELYETGDGFGLFTSKGVPKVSGTYLHNMAVVLNDAGSTANTFPPATITLGLSTVPSTMVWDLFAKSNGHYQWIIWNNINDWSGSSPVTISPQSVTVTFPAQGTIAVYDPTIGVVATATTQNIASATVSVTDHPIVVDWIQTSI